VVCPVPPAVVPGLAANVVVVLLFVLLELLPHAPSAATTITLSPSHAILRADPAITNLPYVVTRSVEDSTFPRPGRGTDCGRRLAR
jgi:hypothetical protein